MGFYSWNTADTNESIANVTAPPEHKRKDFADDQETYRPPHPRRNPVHYYTSPFSTQNKNNAARDNPKKLPTISIVALS